MSMHPCLSMLHFNSMARQNLNCEASLQATLLRSSPLRPHADSLSRRTAPLVSPSEYRVRRLFKASEKAPTENSFLPSQHKRSRARFFLKKTEVSSSHSCIASVFNCFTCVYIYIYIMNLRICHQQQLHLSWNASSLSRVRYGIATCSQREKKSHFMYYDSIPNFPTSSCWKHQRNSYHEHVQVANQKVSIQYFCGQWLQTHVVLYLVDSFFDDLKFNIRIISFSIHYCQSASD